MTRAVVAALLVVFATACTTMDYQTGRDTVAIATWQTRGETVGDLAFLYCANGTPRERLMFLWGIQRTAGRHKITIECDTTEPPFLSPDP